MSIKELATELQAQGRGKDSMLVHMSPTEVNSLRELAQATGGDLTVNPDTGLLEAGWLEQILPIVAGAAAMFIPGLQGVGATLIAGAMAGGATAMALGGGPDEVAGGMMGGASGASMGSAMGIGAGGAEGVAAGMGAEAAAGAGSEAALVDVLGDGVYASQAAGYGGEAALVDVLGDGVYSSYGVDGYGSAADAALMESVYGTAGDTAAIGDTMRVPDGSDPFFDTAGGGADTNLYGDNSLMQDTYGFDQVDVPGDTMQAPGTSDPFVDSIGDAAVPGKTANMDGATIKKYLQRMQKAAQTAQKAGLLGPNGEPKKQPRQLGPAPGYNPPDMLNSPTIQAAGFQPTWRQGRADSPIPGARRASGGIMDAEGMSSGGFVVPADAVSAAGNGSTDAGLRALAAFGAAPIRGPGDGLSDDIPTKIDGMQPARVADGEAYIPPEMVERIGGGDHRRGAQRLYAMLDRIRDQAHGKTEQQRPVDIREALQ